MQGLTGFPGLMLTAKKAGEVVELLSSNAGTNKDITIWSKKADHKFMGTVEVEGYWRQFNKRVK